MKGRETPTSEPSVVGARAVDLERTAAEFFAAIPLEGEPAAVEAPVDVDKLTTARFFELLAGVPGGPEGAP